MKTLVKTTVLAAGALLIAGTASAEIVTKDAVKNSFGNPVKSTNGNCVITKWDGPASECGAGYSSDARTVYFDFASAVITPAGKAKLDTLASALKGDKSVKTVRIVGFTDMIGTKGYNNALSLRRAVAVKSYLESKGVVVNGKSEVRGLGASATKSECKGQKGKALKACLWRDRRVEVEITQ
jgi:outer membrane protein OmpA-like peptidoglycan-associated protein